MATLDCLGYNKTGFRDNLGLFSGIFHNFFSDAAYHFWKLFEGCLFQLHAYKKKKSDQARNRFVGHLT
jgi:hypothetical protein